jgi:Ca-activated chloride channel family protein
LRSHRSLPPQRAGKEAAAGSPLWWGFRAFRGKALRRGGVVCLISCALCLFAQEGIPNFRVDVKLVTVIATVKDKYGAPAGELEKEDFTVLASGVPQEIAVFERQTGRPLSVILLFDSSPSVAKELKFEQDSAVRFIRSLLGSGANPEDRIAVLQFSEYVREVQGFTASPDRLEKAVLSIRTSGGTSMYDALYLAAHSLEGRRGRRVIVIITDGGDTTSSIGFSEALEAAQLADAVVYSIIVVPVTSDAGRNLGGENALKTMSASTGGLAFVQYDERDLDRAFRQIERDLRLQYVIGFYPRGVPPSPERFHRLEVRVNRPDMKVLARTGYFSGPDPERDGSYSAPVAIGGATPRQRSAPATAPRKKKDGQSQRSIP